MVEFAPANPYLGPGHYRVQSLWDLSPEAIIELKVAIENLGMDIPVSQVIGFQQQLQPAATIQTVGAPLDGRTVLLRLGGSPYEYVTVAYDITYQHWVSQTFQSRVISGGAWTNTSYAATPTSEVQQPWAKLATAGLVPQFRLVAMLDNTVGGDITYLDLGYYGITNDGAASTAVAVTGTEISVTGVTPTFRDSGWQPIPGGYTVKDQIAVGIRSKVNAGAGSLTNGVVYVRWVG